MALRYIHIVGGKELLSRAGLGRLAPKWKGEREDLVSVLGKKSKNPKFWTDSNRENFEMDKRRIMAMVVEILVNLVMSSHVYSFGGKYYLQRDGGSIGLRLTACLAALIMKLWDVAWSKLIKRENLRVHDMFRYVDDYRNCLQVLMEGWRWNGREFEFRYEWEIEDVNSEFSDQYRTTMELTKAMSSLVPYLKFEGEEASMFLDKKLPTLYKAVWWEDRQLMFEFYEKEMCPNKVLQRDTALSDDSIRASLNKEVVRRLLYCKAELPITAKQKMCPSFYKNW